MNVQLHHEGKWNPDNFLFSHVDSTYRYHVAQELF